MNRVKRLVLLLLITVLITEGCSKTSSTSSPTATSNKGNLPTVTSSVSIPPFQVDSTRDVSLYRCVRIIADVVVQKTGPLTDEQLLQIARIVVNDITSSKRVNAIGIFFYHSATDIGLGADASVDWAPHGEWGEAYSVPTGDYSEHSYRVDFNNT